MRHCNPIIVKLRKESNIKLDSQKVMYIERVHNETLDKAISSAGFALNLVYLPTFAKALAKKFAENGVMDYYNPMHRELSFDHVYDIVLDYVEEPSAITHGLLNYTSVQDDDYYHCSFVALPSDFDVKILPLIIDEIFRFGREYSEKMPLWSKPLVLYRREDDYIDFILTKKFKTRTDKITKQLISELINKINRLKERGMSLELIYNIIGSAQECVTTQELSRIIVDARYRIYLPDYGDLEVKMTPLVKTVYIFFLKHPKGVFMKEIPDHYNELLGIYQHITAFSDSNTVKKAIRRLCNPMDNSMNEKCSRIKLTFKSLFDERLAEYYYVSGGRKQKQYIPLESSMIEFINENYKAVTK